MKLSSTITKSIRRCVKPLAITALSIWALVVTIPVAAQVYTSYAALDGSASAPSYSFNSSTNSGIYRDPVGASVNIASGGVNALKVFSTGSGQVMVNGQLRASQSTAPTISGTSTISGTDTAAIITVAGAPATLTITFGKAWTVAPACMYNDQTTANANGGKVLTTTTTAVITLPTFTGAAATFATDTVGYICIGN
jgi:hypothetical protein